MKTLKITDQAHKRLTEIIALIYNDTGIKLTYSDVIERIADFKTTKSKGVYHFNDK